MQQLVLVLRRSRLIQVLLTFVVVAVAGAVGFLLSEARVLPSLSITLLAGVIAILALRQVQLEWRVATADKSAMTRKLEFEKKLEVLARSLRAEFSERAVLVASGGAATLKTGEVSTGSAGEVVVMTNRTSDVAAKNSLVIGRNAARVPESEARQMELQRLLHPSGPNTSRGKVLGVLSPELKRVLDEHYEVVELSPSLAREQASTAAGAIFVIDERSLEQGPWFGADAAGGTALFSELNAAVDLAVDQGAFVWFVATGAVPRPYTNKLRDKAVGVVGLNASDPHWGEDLQVEFVELMDDYVMGLGK